MVAATSKSTIRERVMRLGIVRISRPRLLFMPLLNTSAVGLARTVIRQARPEDLPSLVSAADGIFRSPAKPGLGSMGRDYPLLFSEANAANLYLAESRRHGD